jgi:hypothetical protein
MSVNLDWSKQYWQPKPKPPRSKWSRAKSHLKRNKGKYLAGLGGLAALGLGYTAYQNAPMLMNTASRVKRFIYPQMQPPPTPGFYQRVKEGIFPGAQAARLKQLRQDAYNQPGWKGVAYKTRDTLLGNPFDPDAPTAWSTMAGYVPNISNPLPLMGTYAQNARDYFIPPYAQSYIPTPSTGPSATKAFPRWNQMTLRWE